MGAELLSSFEQIVWINKGDKQRLEYKNDTFEL